MRSKRSYVHSDEHAVRHAWYSTRVTVSLAQRLEAYRKDHPVRTIATRRGTFEYSITAPRDGASRWLVVLHGGGSHAEAAHPFSLALEEERRVIAIDWPSSARTVEDVLSGIDAILDAESVQTAAFLGFSMGGMIAQRYAESRSARVERLVLYVSMGPSERYAKRFRRYRRLLSIVPDGWLRAASKRAVSKWATAASADDPEAAAFIAEQRRSAFDAGKVTKASLLSDADILVDFFATPIAAGAIACPVLIVEAEGDRMVDAHERAASKSLHPAARVVTLASTDHFAGVLAPGEIVSELRSFLRG